LDRFIFHLNISLVFFYKSDAVSGWNRDESDLYFLFTFHDKLFIVAKVKTRTTASDREQFLE